MRSTRVIALAGAVAAVALAGCGGDDERQDADEPSGTFDVKVVEAKFPEKQELARREEMVVVVRNEGSQAVPDVAVTIDSFTRRSEQAGLADPERPVWIVDSAPQGGTTAYVSTWALGRLEAGQQRTFTWRVTPVVPGRHTVKYRIAAGLDGQSRAQTSDGAAPEGEFTVTVSDKPRQARVDPKTGEVVRAGDGS